MLIPIDEGRRHLLRLAAVAATAAWIPRSAWSQPKWARNPFALGVASGSPTHDGVVLWTRLVGDVPAQPVTVRWEIAHDEAFTRIARSGQQEARAELAHSVHAEVTGLAPDRWYFYRFMSGDAVSATGRTRTFPAADADVRSLRLAYASCQRWEHGHFSAWRHMRDEHLDAVLFLGDYIYEYPGAVNAVRPGAGGWLLTLDDYRARHAMYRGDADLQAMHAACPWLVTWDDHEVQNDYAALAPGNGGPHADDFAVRRTAAYQAFYEHMPLRASSLTRAVAGLASAAEMRLYAQVRFGRLANILMLDDRQYRSPQACTTGGKAGSSIVDPAGCATWDNPARTLLGGAQEQWLDDALQGGGMWTVVGQQTLFGRRDAGNGPGARLWNDGWDGYPAARARFTDALQRHKVANPVLLGGDVHENWVGHVKADYTRPAAPSLGVEFCGTSITSRSAGNRLIPQLLDRNPHFVFADSHGKGYGVVEFAPAGLTTTLRVVDDVTRSDSGIQTLASFSVEAGRRIVERIR